MIHINIDNAKKCNGDYALFVTFDFDMRIVSIIREFPSRYWNADKKEWELPFNKLGDFLNRVQWCDVEITGQYVSLEKPKAEVPANFSFKTNPYEHQIVGFNYGLNNDRWLLGDEMGLGKTKQVIDIAVAKKLIYGYKHCLIICGVNGLKWNWYDEVHTHSNETAHILGQRMKKNKLVIGSNADKLSDLNALESISSYFIITNVESLRDDKISAKLSELCAHKSISMIAFDECHKCFSYDTKIQTRNGMKKIGDIVSNKELVEVLSFNETTHEYEWKAVTNWFKNVVCEKLICLTIQTACGIKTVQCTKNHLIYTTNRGWVQAQNLTYDDDIAEINALY